MPYYDDNFGEWEGMDEEENREFYRSVARRSVWKKCCDCGKRVKILPEYCRCDACCRLIVSGGGY